MKRNATLVLALLFALAMILTACGPAAEVPPPPAEAEGQPEAQPEAMVTEAYPQPQAAAAQAEPGSPYPGPGGDVSNYTTWGKAAEAVLGGQVKEIFYAADGHITLVLQDGSVKLVLEKPAGELAKLLETCGDPCAAIKVNR
ncbi:MAG: hypothetical protein L0Z70_09400 [Chloroflexi bacterium]|nr:hypothetical protein [Chloroflexota bacterium]